MYITLHYYTRTHRRPKRCYHLSFFPKGHYQRPALRCQLLRFVLGVCWGQASMPGREGSQEHKHMMRFLSISANPIQTEEYQPIISSTVHISAYIYYQSINPSIHPSMHASIHIHINFQLYKFISFTSFYSCWLKPLQNYHNSSLSMSTHHQPATCLQLAVGTNGV